LATRFEHSQVDDIGTMVSWQQIAETLVDINCKVNVGEPLPEAVNCLSELLGVMAFERRESVAWSILNEVQKQYIRSFHEQKLTTQLSLA
jgi:hypothetical protein